MKKYYHYYAIVTKKRRNYSIVEHSFTTALSTFLVSHGIGENQIRSIERLDLFKP